MKSIWNTVPCDDLLANTSNHLRDVDNGTCETDETCRKGTPLDIPLDPHVAIIKGALCLLSSFMQISPTSSRTFESSDEIRASNVCSWLQPGLFSSFPFFARAIRSWHFAYAASTRVSFLLDNRGPGMTSLMPNEKPKFAEILI